MKVSDKNWKVQTSECGQYLYVTRPGKPGMVQIKSESEGVVVDIFCDDATQEPVGSTYAFDQELSAE